MKYLFVFMISFCSLHLSAQQDNITVDTSFAIQFINNWVEDLTEMGVRMDKDSLILNPEVVQLLQDSSYRKSVYPIHYSWPVTIDWLQKMQLKKAFWCMINLYNEDSISRALITNTILSYDQAIDMEKAILAAYYTYSFADPSVGEIANNKFIVGNTELLEKKFNQMKEMISIVLHHRIEMNKLKAETHVSSPHIPK